MKLIDKAALLAEIDKRKEALETSDGRRFNSLSDQILWNAFNSIQDVIDTLEVKEVDLEKETKKWWKEHLHLNPENKLWMDAHQSIVFAKHFFELGMQVSNKAQKGE